MKTIKMALVGAGTWGANHARIYKAHPFADIVAICDMNREKAEKVAREEGIPQVYTDYKKMFAESDCDAVAIVTPDFAHADIAVAAANAGKHILIEKPLATTREDALRILEACERNNVRGMVDLHNRWNPAIPRSLPVRACGRIGQGLQRLLSPERCALGSDGYVAVGREIFNYVVPGQP